MNSIRCIFVATSLGVLALTMGCSKDAATTGSATISVESTADTCDVGTTTTAAGSVTFSVENTGSESTEFYVYADDGETVVGEVEDIGPTLTRDLTLSLDAGSYVTACKPGMTGDGIRGELTVTEAE